VGVILVPFALGACGRTGYDAVANTQRDAAPADAAVPADAPPPDAPPPDAPVVSIVFVSSVGYGPNLGGLAGADTRCQTLAAAAGLSGSFRAILSDAATSAKDRLQIAGAIRDVTGTLIATGEADLWDGSIAARIRMDERGIDQGSQIVWSGTDWDGVRDRDPSWTWCGGWTSAAGGVEAGRTDRTDTGWIDIYGAAQPNHACTNTSRLYCVQSP
jgi:hypothetical protein